MDEEERYIKQVMNTYTHEIIFALFHCKLVLLSFYIIYVHISIDLYISSYLIFISHVWLLLPW